MRERRLLCVLVFLITVTLKATGVIGAYCSDNYDIRALNLTQCLYKTTIKIRDGFTPCYTAEWSVICTFVPTGSCSRLIEAHKHVSRMTAQMYPDLLENCLILVPSTGVMVVPSSYIKPDCRNYRARLAGMTDCLRKMAENIYTGERICSAMPEAASCWWKLAQGCPLLKQVFHNMTHLVNILYDVEARNCAVSVADLMVMVPQSFRVDMLVVCPKVQRCALPVLQLLGSSLDEVGNIPAPALDTVRVLPTLWYQVLLGDTSLLQTMCRWNAMLDIASIANCLGKEYFECTGEFILAAVRAPPDVQLDGKNLLFTEAIKNAIESGRPKEGAMFARIMDMLCLKGCSNIEDRKDSLYKCTLAAHVHSFNLNINTTSELDAALADFCGAMQVIASCLSELAHGCPAMAVVVNYGLQNKKILPNAAKYCQLNFDTLQVGSDASNGNSEDEVREFDGVLPEIKPQYLPGNDDESLKDSYLPGGTDAVAPSASFLYISILWAVTFDILT